MQSDTAIIEKGYVKFGLFECHYENPTVITIVIPLIIALAIIVPASGALRKWMQVMLKKFV